MEPYKILLRFDSRAGAREWVSLDVRSTVPGWMEQQFSDPISSLFFPFGDGRMLVMRGMEQYNFNIEGCVSLGSPSKGAWSRADYRIVPVSWHFYGRIPGRDEVSLWSISRELCSHKTVRWGREYHGTAVSGWKPGRAGNRSVSWIFNVEDVNTG